MNIESEIIRVQEFVDKANYHAAINIAISGLNQCRKIKDQSGIDKFIDIMRDIINTMAKEFGSK